MEHIVVLQVDPSQNHVFVPLLVVEVETLAPSWAISNVLAHLIFAPTWGKLLGLGSYLGDVDFSFFFLIPCDTPPHSLKDSNVSLKVKTMEGIRVCSLARNTSGVEGHARTLGWGLGHKWFNYSHEPTQTKQQVG